MRIASVATIPNRINTLKSMSIAVLPQVDEFHVYNGEDERGDANKFRGVAGKDGYLFTLDDDILYPSNYIDFMIHKIEEYKRNAVITLHGKVLRKQPISSFYGSDFIKYRCMGEVNEDVNVHIPGTGVMGWHSSTIDFDVEAFKERNMADIWAGIQCEKQGVDRVCVAHDRGYLKNMNRYSFSCYQDNKSRDRILTKTINSIEWKQLS